MDAWEVVLSLFSTVHEANYLQPSGLPFSFSSISLYNRSLTFAFPAHFDDYEWGKLLQGSPSQAMLDKSAEMSDEGQEPLQPSSSHCWRRMQSNPKNFGDLSLASYVIWALILQCSNITKRAALPQVTWSNFNESKRSIWKILERTNLKNMLWNINLDQLLPQVKIQTNNLLIDNQFHLSCGFGL